MFIIVQFKEKEISEIEIVSETENLSIAQTPEAKACCLLNLIKSSSQTVKYMKMPDGIIKRTL